MKVLFAVLVLSIGAVLVAVGAMLWRLRWHLRRPHVHPETPAVPPLEVVELEHSPADVALK